MNQKRKGKNHVKTQEVAVHLLVKNQEDHYLHTQTEVVDVMTLEVRKIIKVFVKVQEVEIQMHQN